MISNFVREFLYHKFTTDNIFTHNLHNDQKCHIRTIFLFLFFIFCNLSLEYFLLSNYNIITSSYGVYVCECVCVCV